MAFRCVQVVKLIRNASLKTDIAKVLFSTSSRNFEYKKPNELKTESNLIYYEDPDKFGTLCKKIVHHDLPEDEDDVIEKNFQQNLVLPSQQLTTKQYADLIKQYLKYKRLKEAIDVLEVKMLIEDKVKPENYIYNILIGACAEVGYTKKAFKLFNDMKRRGLKPTGDTYTCLFTACANSPWPANGLKLAHHIRNLLVDKGIEPNITNYNSMIKSFGKCGDIVTAFKIVDEMILKKIPIRNHTFNHLLIACISDKQHGLKQALIVWHKMLKMKEKPNTFSFNLMLRCIKECDVGTVEDMSQLLSFVQESILVSSQNTKVMENTGVCLPKPSVDYLPKNETSIVSNTKVDLVSNQVEIPSIIEFVDNKLISIHKEALCHSSGDIQNSDNKLISKQNEIRLPNLLSRNPNLEEVLALQNVLTKQDKFNIIGGQEGFLKEMQKYSLKPDIKTFTQMLMVINETKESEIKLIEQMKMLNVWPDIDFYNMLIKKRALRMDYNGAFEVLKYIDDEIQYRKMKHPLKRKLKLKLNIMTYGVLAMACKTKEDAEKLLQKMKEKQLKVNVAILGTLLKNGIHQHKFDFVISIMKYTKEENLAPNDIFIKHLEGFKDSCDAIIQKENASDIFTKAYKYYMMFYKKWLQDINIEEVLKPEDPWEQFNNPQPDTVQHQDITIKMPKRFYKKKRKFVPPYKSKI